MHHFSLVPTEFGCPSTGMMGRVVKWRVMMFILPLAHGHWSGLKTAWMSGTEPYSYRGQSLLVAQGLVLGPELFNLIVNEPGWLFCCVCTLAGDTKLRGVADAPELGCHPERHGQAEGMWQNPHNVQPRDIALGRSSPMHCCRLGLTPERPLGSWWIPRWP